MELRERFVLRPKTTMRIGGEARYFAELVTREDAEEALRFASEHKLPLIALGSGSNTIFSQEVRALVVQVKYAATVVRESTVTVGAGKNLAMLLGELGLQGLDLSSLTGIPGTVGGAVVGNAGQGPRGVWIDSFIESVTVYDGMWKTLSKEECAFGYRESLFKRLRTPMIVWEVVMSVPRGEPSEIKKQTEQLLQKRIETQPHQRTAGSCFKAVGQTPAWKLIDAAGLRQLRVGGIEISQKHANFLINANEGSYDDAVALVEEVRRTIPEDLDVEMRFIEPDGSLKF